MEKLVQKYRRARRLQDAEAVNVQIRGRYLDYHYDEDGCLVVNARVPADQGTLIIKALEKAMDDTGFVSREEAKPVSANRADALSTMAEGFLMNTDRCGSGGDRYQVIVHVSAESSGDTPHIHDGPHVVCRRNFPRRLGRTATRDTPRLFSNREIRRMCCGNRCDYHLRTVNDVFRNPFRHQGIDNILSF